MVKRLTYELEKAGAGSSGFEDILEYLLDRLSVLCTLSCCPWSPLLSREQGCLPRKIVK